MSQLVLRACVRLGQAGPARAGPREGVIGVGVWLRRRRLRCSGGPTIRSRRRQPNSSLTRFQWPVLRRFDARTVDDDFAARPVVTVGAVVEAICHPRQAPIELCDGRTLVVGHDPGMRQLPAKEPRDLGVVLLGVVVFVEKLALPNVGRIEVKKRGGGQFLGGLSDEINRIHPRYMNAMAISGDVSDFGNQVLSIESSIHLPRPRLLASTDEAPTENSRPIHPVEVEGCERQVAARSLATQSELLALPLPNAEPDRRNAVAHFFRVRDAEPPEAVDGGVDVVKNKRR